MTILDRIVRTKRDEIARARSARSLAELKTELRRVQPPRDFYEAVTTIPANGIHLIAEVKKASPSAGIIVEGFDPAKIARTYHRHGAAAISVLTDSTFFQGRLEHIGTVKRGVPLPVLRKEFILDEYQLYEARVAGADAVLLITEILGADALAYLLEVTRSLRMTPLVEVHSDTTLRTAIEAGGVPGAGTYIMGINNRDLAIQKVDLTTTVRLARLIPRGAPFVAESGINRREDVLAMQRAGASAVLVGESLLRSSSIPDQIDALLGR
ncbi:MAG: indole-3-glycerol phosphate synthase TrpC [Phycisphaerae bacterium]